MKSVLNPVVKGLEPPMAGKVNQNVGMRFTVVAWIGILLLLVTGITRMFGGGKIGALDDLLNTTYGLVLTIKITLFVVAVIVAAMITINGKKMGELSQQTPPPVEQMTAAAGRINLLFYCKSCLGDCYYLSSRSS